MKKFLKILAVPAGLVLFYIVVVLCVEFFYVLSPSKGHVINIAGNTKSAIMVIDVQNKLTYYDNEEMAHKYKVDIFLKNINTVVDKLNKLETIYIRQEFPKNSLLSFLLPTFPEEGDPGTAVNKTIFRGNSKIFTKSKGDAFTNPSLQEYLESKNIGTLYVTGLAAEFCVDNTIRGAAAKGYKVYVVKDAVLSASGGEPSLKRIEKYKSYGATVISVKDLK